jgi:hypothetical protein
VNDHSAWLGIPPRQKPVTAHNDIVQEIWMEGTENNGVHFAPEMNAMAMENNVVHLQLKRMQW